MARIACLRGSMISTDGRGRGGLELDGQSSGKRKRQSPSKNPSSPEYKHPPRAASSVPDEAAEPSQPPSDDAAAQAKVARKLMFQSGDAAAARRAQSRRSKVVSQKETPASEQQEDEAGPSDRSEAAGGKKRKRRGASSDSAQGAEGAAVKDTDARDVRGSSVAEPDAGQKETSVKGGARKKKKTKRVEAVDASQDDGVQEPGEGGDASSSGQLTAEPGKEGAKGTGKKKQKRRTEESSGVEQNADRAAPGAEPAEEASPGSSGAMAGIMKLSKGKSRKKVTFEVPAEPAPAPQDAPAEASAEAEDDPTSLRAPGWARDNQRQDLVTGRFSKEEDQLLKQSVSDYIRAHGWTEEGGLNKLLSGVSSKECSGCWFEIGNCLPRRSIKALYSRAHRLLDPGNHRGKWSAEEEESLIRLHAEHGSNWAKISKLLGRYTYNIKDKWRDLKLRATHKTGPIQQSELEKVAALVHKFVRTKSLLGKEDDKKDRRQIRDGINWDAIAEALGTRSHSIWCKTWYVTLASSMVAEGLWDNIDDHRLLRSLLESGASADEAVDWDNLLDNREGHICQRRWEQMAKHLGPHRLAPFEERLQRLVIRYTPYLLEEGDRQPHVDAASE